MNANLGSPHFNIWGVVTSFQCQNRRGVSLRAGHVKFRNLTASSFHHFKTSLRFFLDALQKSQDGSVFYAQTFALILLSFWKPAVHRRNCRLGLAFLADIPLIRAQTDVSPWCYKRFWRAHCASKKCLPKRPDTTKIYNWYWTQNALKSKSISLQHLYLHPIWRCKCGKHLFIFYASISSL